MNLSALVFEHKGNSVWILSFSVRQISHKNYYYVSGSVSKPSVRCLGIIDTGLNNSYASFKTPFWIYYGKCIKYIYQIKYIFRLNKCIK